MSTETVTLKVSGMDCANCVATVRKGVESLEGVEEVDVTLSTETLRARGSASSEAIIERVKQLGYGIEDAERTTPDEPTGVVDYLTNRRETAVPLVFAVLLLLSLPASFIELSPVAQWAVRGLHIAAIVAAGWPIMRKGVKSLFFAKRITIDLLMTIATLGAFAIGETGEAATVVVLFAIGEALESYSADRARASLKGLLKLVPEKATVLEGDHEHVVDVGEVAPGDVVLVKPGERVPVDGTITQGTSHVTQAAITGESMPVSRSTGDTVFAGTINGEGALTIKAEREAGDSTLSRIASLVEQAQSNRAPIERWIDRFATWYTPAVVLLALLVAVVPPLAFGAPFLDPASGAHGWLYRGLALLIVACPCALVISTPVTVVSAISGLAQRGVLIKGGAYLEALSRITTIAFDKTGTLTEGRPQVIDCTTASCQPHMESCPDCDDMLALAAAVERRSEHPLATAITNEANKRGVRERYTAAEGVAALAGRGVAGQLDGDTVRVGKHALFHEEVDGCGGLHDRISQAEAQGDTVVLVGKNQQVLGYVTIADQPREVSKRVLSALSDLHTIMLTGDSQETAERIATQLGHIDEVRANLLPEDKLDAIKAMDDVVMVGDGINDAPALAAANVGIAMGGAGTAQAMETADVVLMQDDLTRLPDAIETSRRAGRVIKQNIVLALGLKLAVLVLTLTGFAALWLAVVADVGSSLIVTFNGMRLLREG